MGLCWKWYRRDHGGFPIFSGGLPLFCNGGLATECCPEKIYYYCKPHEDDNDGWDEDPCDPPMEWDGKYEIVTVCHQECGDYRRPKAIINVGASDPCKCLCAVVSEWAFGKVAITLGPFEAARTATWTVTVNGYSEKLTRQIELSDSEPVEYFLDADYYEDVFGDLGIIPIESKIVDQDGKIIHGSINYIFSEEWDASRASGSLSIHPVFHDRFESYSDRMNPPPMINSSSDLSGEWNLMPQRLKTYDTYEEAIDVLNQNEDILNAYANNCVCPPTACGPGEEGGAASWDEAGSYWLDFDLIGGGFSIPGCWWPQTLRLHIENYSNFANGELFLYDVSESPHAPIFSTTAPGVFVIVVPECTDPNFRIEAADGAGEIHARVENLTLVPEGNCTDELMEAFEAIPDDYGT